MSTKSSRSSSSAAPTDPVSSASSSLSVSHLYLLYCDSIRLFCLYHGNLQFNRCLHQLTNNSDLQRNKLWLELINPLKLLCEAERIYYEFQYLTHRKLITRGSNNLQTITATYNNLPQFTKKIIQTLAKLLNKPSTATNDTTNETAKEPNNNSSNPAADLSAYEPLVSDAIQALNQYTYLVNYRLTIIPVYTSLCNRTKSPDYYSIVSLCEKLNAKYSHALTHPYLAGIKQQLIIEIELLERLFRAEIYTQSLKFKEVMINQLVIKHQLTNWINSVKNANTSSVTSSISTSTNKAQPLTSQSSASNLLTSSSSNSNNNNPLFQPTIPLIQQWFFEFLSSILCKSSLYFHSILKEKSMEVKENLAEKTVKLELDLSLLLDRFVKRSLANCCLLLFDCSIGGISSNGTVSSSTGSNSTQCTPLLQTLPQSSPLPPLDITSPIGNPSNISPPSLLQNTRDSYNNNQLLFAPQSTTPNTNTNSNNSLANLIPNTANHAAVSSLVSLQHTVGYELIDWNSPENTLELPTGLKCYPIIFQTPTQFAVAHWALVSIILAKQDQLNNGEVVFDFDRNSTGISTNKSTSTHSNVSYLIGRVDPRMYICLVTPLSKKLQETVLTEFKQIIARLKHIHMFQALNPTSKIAKK